MLRILALPLGFVLDLILGDPSWIRHPVCWIGDLISASGKKTSEDFSGYSRRTSDCRDRDGFYGMCSLLFSALCHSLYII